MIKVTIPFDNSIIMIMSFLDSHDEEIKKQAVILAHYIIRDVNIINIKEGIINYLGGMGGWTNWSYKKRFIDIFGEAILGDQL